MFEFDIRCILLFIVLLFNDKICFCFVEKLWGKYIKKVWFIYGNGGI